MAAASERIGVLATIPIPSPAQQWREHRLQSPDEIVGLLVALQERGDLRNTLKLCPRRA
jgi:hypothetical protein